MRAGLALAVLAAGGGLAWWALSRQDGTPAPAPASIGPPAPEDDGIGPVTVTVERMAEYVNKILLPRGIRNNNPGNIRWITAPAARWRGMVRDDGGGYGVFLTLTDGVRALVKELLLDESRGVRTVAGLITNWAPPVENLTDKYIAAVAAALGVAPGATISVRQRLPELVAAIARHENGRRLDGSDWLTAADIAAGIQAASS